MKKTTALSTLITAILLAAAVFLLSFFQPLYSLDKLISDPLYQSPCTPDKRISIIAIDEDTIAKYGEVSSWSREIPAKLVETLDADPDRAPTLIIFDLMFISDRDADGDRAFAAAAYKYGNVITASNVVYQMRLARTGDGISQDWEHIKAVEYPYEELLQASGHGFANTMIDRDQFIRSAKLYADYDGERIWSLSAETALRLTELTGENLTLPQTEENGNFYFTYTGQNLGQGGAYEIVSMARVLEGFVPDVAGGVVFVGAFAPGMQDSYNAAIQRSAQMYGVEIQANLLQAILEGRTAVAADNLLSSILASLIAVVYYLVCRKIKITYSAILAVGVMVFYLIGAKLLYHGGLLLPVIVPLLAVAAVFLVHLGAGYLAELLRKRRILNAFKKYVAPQVVDEVAAKGDFSIKLGGEKRHIAVLFVDIRGFTPMSEGLQPEQVVEILNEYLSLTTKAIFQNGGTLDKFIGDATMAVFNAPFDLDDYVYRAVCTAKDIAAGSDELERRLMERFGKSVSFGIGVNCGDAVVGNIGSDFRMDYTAIGDTVNTAARLESNAGRGQILISQSVYEAVKERISVTDVGAIPLKGKSQAVYVYQLDEVR